MVQGEGPRVFNRAADQVVTADGLHERMGQTVTEAPSAVVGSGASGMFQALYLAKVRRKPVVLIEQAPVIGGMFASEQTAFGPADQGAYLLQECGHAGLDALFFECLPPQDWHVLDGVRRDIAGNFFRGQLDQGSLYADLRKLPAADIARCLADIQARANGPVLDFDTAANLAAYVESRFGPGVAEKFIVPLTQKIWRQPPDKLSAWAAKIVHLTRVVIHGPEDSLRLKEKAELDRVLGYPDQLSFPPARLAHHRRALYPRRFGLQSVADGLKAALIRHGVQIITGAKVTGVQLSGSAVGAITVEMAEGVAALKVSGLLWTTALPAALALLGGSGGALANPPIPHRLVYLFLDRPPQTGPLYWFWSYDPANAWVRISVPGAYCPAANDGGRYPICIETHVPQAAAGDAEVVNQVTAELRSAGIVTAATQVVGSHVLKGLRGYFVPSLANLESMQDQRAALDARLPKNMYISSQDLSSGVFYLPDILRASAPILERM